MVDCGKKRDDDVEQLESEQPNLDDALCSSMSRKTKIHIFIHSFKILEHFSHRY